MSTYHKVYTDHVHSSTLMSQFTQLWKNCLMCDAKIITGNTVIKAHRLVLVASCAVLQSYDSTAEDSVLEITLPDNITSETVYTFLEFLYEGHIIITEDNVKRIEQIARLMHVDRILKCCSDFSKSLKSSNDDDNFNFHDLKEVNHVRVTSFIKTRGDNQKSDEIDREGNRHGGQSNNHEHSTMKSPNNRTSSVSFQTSPVITEMQRIHLRKEYPNSINSKQQTSSENRTNNHQNDNILRQGVIDLSHGYSSLTSSGINSGITSQHHQSEQPRIYTSENTVSNLNTRRRHSDQNISRPSSVDATNDSHTNDVSKSQDYYRSLSDECMNHNNLRNTVALNNVSQYGFVLPGMLSPLWSDQSMVSLHQPFRCSSDNSISTTSTVTSTGPQSIRVSSNLSRTSQHGTRVSSNFSASSHQGNRVSSDLSGSNHQSTRVSSDLTGTSPQGTRLNRDLTGSSHQGTRVSCDLTGTNQGTREETDMSDVPITVRQEDFGDNRLVLDVSEIDLSMIKTENTEEPLDLHVEGMIQDAEAGRMDASILDTKNIPDDVKGENHGNQETGTNDYSAIYSDLAKQWSSQLQPNTLKKRPTSKSTNVRRIIQDLNLNRRALASPAALGSIAVGHHKPVRMPGKNNYKVCSLCYRNKIRTKSGYYVYSYYKCSVCDVPLCIGSRKCFLQYHRGAETTGEQSEGQ